MTIIENNNCVVYRIPCRRKIPHQTREPLCFSRAVMLITPDEIENNDDFNQRVKIIRDFQKSYGEAMIALPCLSYWGRSPEGKKILEQITPFNALALFNDSRSLFRLIENYCEKTDPENRRPHTSVTPYLHQFVNNPENTTNLSDYFAQAEYHIRMKHHRDLLEQWGSKETLQIIDRDYNSSNIENLKLKSQILQDATHHAITFKMCLSPTNWTPMMTHSVLLNSLKNEGPQIAVGNLGLMFYGTPPSVKATLGDRKIYGWSPGAKTLDNVVMHSIVVIGAARFPNQEVVYYIDPSDESDPQNPELQRIYTISYLRFTERISKFFNFLPDSAYTYKSDLRETNTSSHVN